MTEKTETSTVAKHESDYYWYWIHTYEKDYSLTPDKYPTAEAFSSELATLALDEEIIPFTEVEKFKVCARATFYSETVKFVTA